MTAGLMSRSAAEQVLDRPRLSTGGAALTRARAVLILLHGRGSEAAGILPLGEGLAFPELALLAPEALGRSWYPHSFLAPLEDNEPALTRSLDDCAALVADLIAGGVPSQRIAFLGFSQGASLLLEHAIRHPRRYGGLIAFSGGLIGPPGHSWPSLGDLEGTPAFLGCSDIDSHVPLARVRESTAVLRRMGASVAEAIYPGFGHAINDDEIRHARRILVPLLD